MSELLKTKILTKEARIAVIGLGYVGLPLAVHFAKAGYVVYGLDTDQDRVTKVNARESYILDVASADLAEVVASGRLEARTSFDVLKSIDAIIICVPTPLRRKYTPDISYMVHAVKTVTRFLKKDTLVVLESTTYPGTTEELILPELKKSRLKLDRDFFLAFSPERIDPGNPQFDVTKIPKVVGGVTPESGALTKLLYEQIITRIHVVSSAKAAEMTKLLENTFRIINIGWVNEAAMMCHKMKIDIWEVIGAAKTKPFGFMPFYPGLGVGGHCIPDDPLYLYWKAKHHGFSSKFIKLSADINSAMPQYCAAYLAASLKKSGKKLARARLLVIGVTYKKDVKDLRKSPPLKLIGILQDKKARVEYHDPIIPYLETESIHLKSVGLTAKNVAGFDCVIIAADHSGVDYEMVLKNAKMIFDIKNVYARSKERKIIRF